MSNMRVHELAKELNISNSEVKDILAKNGIEVGSHMSNIDDAAIAIVKKAKSPKPAPKAEAPKAEAPKEADAAEKPKAPRPEGAPKKPAGGNKVKMTFRADRPGSRDGRPAKRPDGAAGPRRERVTFKNNKPVTPEKPKERVKFVGAMTGPNKSVEVEETSAPVETVAPVVETPKVEVAPAPAVEAPKTEAPKTEAPKAEAAPVADAPKKEAPRQERQDRGPRPERRDGDRPQRREGDRPQRRDGDRPQRRDGERPPRRDGDRNERNPRFDRNNTNGDRARFSNGERGANDRPKFANKDGRGGQGGDRRATFNSRGMGGFGGKDEDEGAKPQSRRRNPKPERSGGGDAPGRDLKSQNRNSYNRDRGKKNKDRRQEVDIEANLSRLAKPTRNKNHGPAPKAPAEDADTIKTITLPESLSLSELADILKEPVNALIKKLFLEGKMYNVNSELDFDTAAEIALEYNCIAEEEEKVDVIEELLKEEEEDESTMTTRPPVVCVMGHVDHGKTSLLDAIRETKVTSGEAGGITQAIGASVVDVNDQTITFLDTPGHEAFTAMRMRGAQSTDIAILVVAADDGVMPQTVEAINHAKAAGIEIIVAINKIDKPSANIERVKQELTEYELIPEDWGGSTIFCPVSAHTKEGLDNLLDMILLTADVLELKANANRKARGIVIEAELDKGRGSVATILVQKGTLHVGEYIAVGASHGKVRAMINSKGERVEVATPSTPVQILGLDSVPSAGEVFMAVENEKEARQISETYISEDRQKMLADTKARMSLDDLYSQIQAGNVKELNIIIKADVQGSVEAVKQSLLKLSNEEVAVKCIHSGVGAINESDIILASASSAIVIGFNVRPDARAKDTADNEGVDVRLYNVIYNAIEDIDNAMKGMLDPIYEEQVIGHIEVRATYKASGVGTIAGSYVLDGTINRNASVRVTREGNLIFEGKLASLKRFKDDVKEVRAGYECGIVLENFNDVAEDDQIEAYQMVEVPRK